jgi:CheY-like chemotaxis protein
VNRKGRFILSVEDDPDTQEMLGVLMEQRGYGFRAVDNCADALRSIREDDPDAVLLDNLLPDGNGIELCRQVRQFNKKIPIIFLSGSAFGDEQEEALESGANAFLTKPLTLDSLFATLKEYAPTNQS